MGPLGKAVLTRILAQYPAILDLATYLSLNKLLGLRVGKSLHAFCDLARQTHRGANHGRTRAPYPVGPSSRRAAHAVPPYPLRRCVAPPQCLCRLGSVRRRGPSDLGGGILREHCRQRGARRHGATSRGAPPWGANAQRAIAYRERLGDQLLATFTERTAHFYQLLQSLGPQDWEKPCYHPLGLRPAQQFITMRLIELAMHAWDIQSALDPTAALFPDSLPVFMELVPRIVSLLRMQPDARRLVPLRCHFTVTGAVPSQYACS